MFLKTIFLYNTEHIIILIGQAGLKKLNIKTKKKSIGLVLIILIFISTTLVYINLEKIDFFSSETENIEPHDDDLKQDESIDPITKNITNMIKK